MNGSLPFYVGNLMDEIDGNSSAPPQIFTVIPVHFTQTASKNDAQSLAHPAGSDSQSCPHARLHAGADAGYDAQSHGQPDASHAS